MGKASTKEIATFLHQCREVIKSSEILPHTFYMTRRAENDETLLSLGFTKQNVKSEIKSLSLENYCEGPLESHEYKDTVWVFGKTINGKEVYIKLSISDRDMVGNRVRSLFCISFHYAKQPLTYPFRVK